MAIITDSGTDTGWGGGGGVQSSTANPLEGTYREVASGIPGLVITQQMVDGVWVEMSEPHEPYSGGGGSKGPQGQMVQLPDGTWVSVDPDQIGGVYGTPADKTPKAEVVTVNGVAYEVTYNPDGTIKGTKPVQGLPTATQPVSSSIITKDVGGVPHQVLINTQTGEVITDYGPLPSDGAPDLKTFPDGSLQQWDKVTKTWTKIADAPPKDTTAIDAAKMQIAANQSENAANRAFNAAENQKNRDFQAGQGKLDRELQLAIQNAQGKAEHEKTQVEAQKGLAQAVNSVDPTQYLSYLLAGGGTVGGGSLENAAKAGASAISDAALYPAARLLQQARSTYQPITMPGAVGAPAGGVGVAPSSRAQRGRRRGGREETAPAATMQEAAMPTSPFGPTGGIQDPNQIPVIAAARGFRGTVRQPTMFLAGEAGRPENVNIAPTTAYRPPVTARTPAPVVPQATPAGAPSAPPVASTSFVPRPAGVAPQPATVPAVMTPPTSGGGVTSTPPVAPTVAPGATVGAPAGGVQAPAAVPAGTGALGGVFGNTGLTITPADRAAMDEILRLRQGVKLPFEGNYGSGIDLFNQVPTAQAAQWMALQAKTGIGAEDWRQQALKMLMNLGGGERGIQRENIGMAY